MGWGSTTSLRNTIRSVLLDPTLYMITGNVQVIFFLTFGNLLTVKYHLKHNNLPILTAAFSFNLWKLSQLIHKALNRGFYKCGCAVTSKRHQPDHGERWTHSPYLPKSSCPKKQPVLTPFSAVHVVSFGHLKAQLISIEQKITSVCMTSIEAGFIWGYILWVSISPTLPQQHIKAVSLIMPGSSTDTA